MKRFLIATFAFICVGRTALAGAYVAARVGVADFIINAQQYMYQAPNAYRSTIVDAVIDDINAAYRAAIGYDFGDVRIDAEYGYGQYVVSGIWTLNTPNGVPGSLPPNLSYPATYTLKTRVNEFMANVYYNVFTFGRKYRNSLYTDINTPLSMSRNSVYVMGGLGFAHIHDRADVSIDTTMAWGGNNLTESDGASLDRFIYSVGGGLELAITCDLSADISYKYTDMGRYKMGMTRRDYSMHELTVGLRYEF